MFRTRASAGRPELQCYAQLCTRVPDASRRKGGLCERIPARLHRDVPAGSVETLLAHQDWGSDQTQANLQALLTAEFAVFSQGEAGAERAAEGRARINCRVVVPDQCVVIMEPKAVSETTAGKNPSQSLGRLVGKRLDLHTNELGGKYSAEGLTVLARC